MTSCNTSSEPWRKAYDAMITFLWVHSHWSTSLSLTGSLWRWEAVTQQRHKNSQFIHSTALIPAAQIVSCSSVWNYNVMNMSNASLFFCSVILIFFLIFFPSSYLKFVCSLVWTVVLQLSTETVNLLPISCLQPSSEMNNITNIFVKFHWFFQGNI